MNQTSSLVQIRMKPYLMKYIRHYLSDDVKVVASNDFADILFSLVRSSDKPVKLIDGENVLTLQLPKRDELNARFDARSCSIYMPTSQQETFNRYVDMLFDIEVYNKLELLEDLNLANRNSGLKKATILSILSKYGIQEEELSYDTVIKRYQRYVLRVQTPMNKAI